MNWITISSEEEVQNIYNSGEYSIIYKHSPRCMTSLMAYRQLKSDVNSVPNVQVPVYIVDVIANRKESQSIASTFQVEHESPQLLIVKNGECLYDSSHEDISLHQTLEYIR
ncbi:bacillithiol system redox-active protein YtxJ [Dyadobacter pollutisoli]|uniref:Bacillithiol system redox-active protein YtxJ n=1 Tax=Dyadobacter pollutisoli TaxID=2910158 RepID=A0A9E8NF49_9BACT|nr:bacillithiol system redox-active protein YtxJ [Dyadobacter pollutisoli]WAC13806.1 bacillithiol system redox-active protein YtxJ [Dyadobacter pollutisoli]